MKSFLIVFLSTWVLFSATSSAKTNNLRNNFSCDVSWYAPNFNDVLDDQAHSSLIDKEKNKLSLVHDIYLNVAESQSKVFEYKSSDSRFSVILTISHEKKGYFTNFLEVTDLVTGLKQESHTRTAVSTKLTHDETEFREDIIERINQLTDKLRDYGSSRLSFEVLVGKKIRLVDLQVRCEI